MRLAAFSVENYRSITTARKIPLGNYSILIGPNNEGKSNILRALRLAMETLPRLRMAFRRSSVGSLISEAGKISSSRVGYDWHRDYPIKRQQTGKGNKVTKVTLDFLLEGDDELQEFRELSKVNVNEIVSVLIEFDSKYVDFSILKQGPGGATLNKAKNRIVDYIARKIKFDYVPAVRTSESAKDVIAGLVFEQLEELYSEKEYTDALEKLSDIERPILRTISEALQNTVRDFLPNVSEILITLNNRDDFKVFRRDIQVMVDDGNLTDLTHKGEGVQSLVALAMMRHSTSRSSKRNDTIIAIEEPESHLHPRAVHELREVLDELSDGNQVVLTTHSPLFVSASRMATTILVSDTKAQVARSLADIRESLGVRLSDNLESARLMLVVEGEDDAISLRSILPAMSQIIGVHLKSGELVIDALGGASKLAQRIGSHKASACMVHGFLDGDKEGKLAIEKALETSIIHSREYTLTSVGGMEECEFEDLYDTKVYYQPFQEKFGVDLSMLKAETKKKKWSDATRRKFEASGKIWNEDEKKSVKIWLAKFAADNPTTILKKEKSTSVVALVGRIEQMLK